MTTVATSPDNRLRLHEIVDELRELEIRIEEAGGEITPEIEAEFDRWEGRLEEKAERILRYFHETARNAEAAKAEADRIRAVHKTLQNRADSLKGLLYHQMRRLGRRDVETPIGKAWIQASRPVVKVRVHPEKLPREFLRIVPETVEADKDAILQAAKEGRDVSEWATVEASDHLRVK